ncbi:MAG: serine/threonine-protein kinase, partial [Cyanobacteria bacterium J06606_4]
MITSNGKNFMLGRTLNGRYRLTRILGAGGFGQTYLAVDLLAADPLPADVLATKPQAEECGTDLQLPVAPSSGEKLCVVKQLKPASQDKNFLQVARRLFDTESKTLKELGHHPQIPNSIDFFEEGNEFYLVQEYIEGRSLEEEIKQAGQFSEAQAIALLEAVLPILEFIHDNHVIHRDLKPDNLIRRQGSDEIVLIDFGAVKELRTHLVTGERTGLTIGIGTQGYTPSEQLSGKPRYSSDLYALGMTVIHALTGRLPADLPEAMGSLEPQWQSYAEVSPGLAILLGKMTRHYIHQRYQRVEEVLHDLSRLEELPAEAAQVPTTVETSMPQGFSGSEAQT